MAVSFPAALKIIRANTITTRVGTSGVLRIYSGTPPANADTALSGNTQLAELACSSTFAAAASGAGVLTANAITQDSSADATGTATCFRLFASDGTTVAMQGSVGTSGADLNLVSTSIVSGQPVQVTSFVWTEGN